MTSHSHHVFAPRRDLIAGKIEQALASRVLTVKELSEQLGVTTATIWNHIPFTDAMPVGLHFTGVGRPRNRYALPGWKPAPGQPATIGVDHVVDIEQALTEHPMTVAELSCELALSESTVRAILPTTRAAVIARTKPSATRKGFAPAVYGLSAVYGAEA